MDLVMRAPRAADLAAIMRIERAGFSPDEAASEESMAERIRVIPDTFIVAEQAGAIAGYIVGPAIKERYLTDDLFAHLTPNEPADKVLSVLSLAVDPQLRGQGIGGALLDAFAARARQQGRQLISLTCLNRLVPYYASRGYVNEGMASSTHAGEIWYNRVTAVK